MKIMVISSFMKFFFLISFYLQVVEHRMGGLNQDIVGISETDLECKMKVVDDIRTG